MATKAKTTKRKTGKIVKAPFSDSKRVGAWKDDYIFQAYKLAREGATDDQIAEACSVTTGLWKRWLQYRPALKRAVQEGRATKFDWSGYAYKRLPERLQRVWDRLCAVEENSPIEVVESILAGEDDRVRRYLWVHALACANFRVDAACWRVGVGRYEVERWKEADPDFCSLVAELMLLKKDFVEGALLDLVAGRDVAATIFANKALNADRGYNPVKKVERTDDRTVLVEVRKLDVLDLESLRKLDEALNPKMIPAPEVEIKS
jgi:hypothetical protein